VLAEAYGSRFSRGRPGRDKRSWKLGTTALLLVALACNETVDPGEDYSVPDVIFDEGFFYCHVEPMIFAQSCGAGNGSGESSGSCHHTQTSFRVVDYEPLVADGCSGDVVASGVSIPSQAKQNYQRAQAKMNRNVNSAALYTKPTGRANHPRVIFDEDSPEADLIREWATNFATQ
jgi:hypothetical protein